MDINKLKEKFFNGDTTIEEEFELRRMLQEETPAGKHDADRGLLLALLPQESKSPAGFEERLSLLIDQATSKTEPQMQPTDEGHDEAKRKILTIHKIVWYTLSAAAAISLICFMNTGETKPKETFSDPKVAAVHIDKTLALFAEALNCGIEGEKEVATQVGSLQAAIGSHLSEDIFK